MESNIISALWGISGLSILIWFIVIYNKIINYEQSSISAESSIDVELKKRSDLIPEAINTVKGFVRHEDQLMKHLTELRADINKLKKEDKQKQLNLDNEFFKNVFAVAESYPNLRSSEAFIKLQDILHSTEANISAARHIYNSNVDYYNSYIKSFPAVIIAGLFGHAEKSYLQFESHIQDRVRVPDKFTEQ
jgi:LemA protein